MTSEIEAVQTAALNELDFQMLAREKMRAAVSFSLVTILEEEVSAFIGADRYERTDTRYHRRQAELDAAIGDMFVYGASTPRVGKVLETLTGDKPSPSTVSRSFTRWRMSLRHGRNARWRATTSTFFWMARTLASSMTGPVKKCPSWPQSASTG